MLSATEITGGAPAKVRKLNGKATVVVDGKVAEEKTEQKVRVVKNKKRGDYTATLVGAEGKPVEGTTSKEFLTKEAAEALTPADFLPKPATQEGKARKVSSSWADKQYEVLKANPARPGTGRHSRFEFIAKHRNTNDVLGKKCEGGHELKPMHFECAVERGFIKFAA